MEYHVNRVHLKVAPFLCDECGRGFYNKSSLIVHNRTHLNMIPKDARGGFHCDGCKRWFKVPSARLTLHSTKLCTKFKIFRKIFLVLRLPLRHF